MRIDEIRPTARIPSEVRSRLGLVVPVDVRFGMDAPPNPLDQEGGYNYEISADDCNLLEAAVADAKSVNYERRQFASAAILGALRVVPPFGPLLAIGGQAIFNLLGKLLQVDFGSLSSGAKRVEGYFIESYPGPETYSVVSSIKRGLSASGNIVTIFSVSSSVINYHVSRSGSSPYYYQAEGGNLYYYGNASALVGNSADYVVNNINASGFFHTNVGGVGVAGYEASGSVDNFDPMPANLRSITRTFERSFASNCMAVAHKTSWQEKPATWIIPPEDCLGPEGKEFDSPPIESLEFQAPDGLPEDSPITPEETRQLIDEIKKTPWMENYGREIPPPAEPPPTQPPAPTGPPHPRDPGWPCPGDGPGGPGSGPGGGGGLPGLPGGNLPGGPGAGNLPGVPDFPGGPGRVQIPGGPGPGRIEGPPFPCDDARYYPGAPVDVQVGEKTRRGRIGASDCQNGTIIPEFPPFGNETFTKPWCRKNILVVDAVKDLAAELGMQNATWAVDPDCRERWTGCFPKSSSKFDAMWALADMCGYDVFPPGEEIGPMKPLPVFHGPYHEARDFWGYSTQKDGLDIPSHVEVYKPNVQGRRGFSIVLPVVTPYNLGDSKFFSTAVGPGVSKNAATNMAFKFKRYFEIRAIAHDVVIPYNALIDKRHQIRLQYPSQGFTERSMVVSYEHEVDMESGAVTKLVVSELSRSTYPKRDDSFAVAWGGSLEAGIRIPKTVDNR